MLFSSESVAAGHPDKVCDQISDAVLDYCLKQNQNARVACEVMASENELLIRGEIGGVDTTTKTFQKEVKALALKVVTDIGYQQQDFDPRKIDVSVKLKPQSADIAQGVDRAGGKQGAGDQGIMFGYATSSTPEGLTVAHMISQEVMAIHNNARHTDWGVKPDAKCQFTLDSTCGENTFVISVSHEDDTDVPAYVKHLLSTLKEQKPWVEQHLSKLKLLVNPTGRFVHCGPSADVGLTGRKIVVDAYGGVCPVGGGCFSGKDPSKVDRSAAYMARYIARKVLASTTNRSDQEVLVGLAYAIGVAEPVGIQITSNFLSANAESDIAEKIQSSYDLTPAGIISFLRLKEIHYQETAKNGHFGHKPILTDDRVCFTWEQ